MKFDLKSLDCSLLNSGFTAGHTIPAATLSKWRGMGKAEEARAYLTARRLSKTFAVLLNRSSKSCLGKFAIAFMGKRNLLHWLKLHNWCADSGIPPVVYLHAQVEMANGTPIHINALISDAYRERFDRWFRRESEKRPVWADLSEALDGVACTELDVAKELEAAFVEGRKLMASTMEKSHVDLDFDVQVFLAQSKLPGVYLCMVPSMLKYHEKRLLSSAVSEKMDKALAMLQMGQNLDRLCARVGNPPRLT